MYRYIGCCLLLALLLLGGIGSCYDSSKGGNKSAGSAHNSQQSDEVARTNADTGSDDTSGSPRETIYFGNYPQGANGEVEPIEWQVLRRDNEGLLVISKYALDYQPYNEDLVDITWSQCTLRRWLNSEFINQAFSESERAQIKLMHLSNPNSKFDSDVPGGPATYDKIFCLSHDEALSLFANDGQRQCYPTAYVKSQFAWTDDNGFCVWWLRSPGSSTRDAACVYSGGGIYDFYVNDGSDAVRPAFFIAL